MIEPVMTDKAVEPTDDVLGDLLKRSFTHFVALREMSSAHNQEWKHYNKKTGWVFKVSNKRRSLFYITPLKGKFHFGMAVNEEDRRKILEGKVCDGIQNELAAAEKVMEGYPVRLDIKTKKDLSRISQVLRLIGRI